MDAKAEIRKRALTEGFDAVGFCAPDDVGDAALRLRQFLALGRHGEMAWLKEKADRRGDPRILWPEARSVLVLGVNYGPARNPLERTRHADRGAISTYAQGADYHDVIKKKLKRLGRWIGERFKCQLKVFVDTAPVPEKPLAQAAGIGWQGKHTNLVSREFGSWLFLGSIYLPLDLIGDGAEIDHCGTCRACLDACPTAAFPAANQLDARRCISYLTIEHPGPIPRGLRRAIGNRIYGCDDCLAVCPWNKFAARTREGAFLPRPELDLPTLLDLAELDEAAFRRIFAGTAIKRSGRARLLRNVAIALGNCGGAKVLPALLRLAEDDSAIVRGAAIWALADLLPSREFAALAARFLPGEIDTEVQSEWQAGLVSAA